MMGYGRDLAGNFIHLPDEPAGVFSAERTPREVPVPFYNTEDRKET
jgi:hypothetical protein